VQLHCHQHGWRVTDRPRSVTFAAIPEAAALVLAERELSRTLFDARAVHRFNPPAAGQHNDPLQCRVLMPVSHPANGLHGIDDCRLCPILFVVPLRSSATNAFQFELSQGTPGLMTNAVPIRSKVPVGNLRRRSRILGHWLPSID